MAQPPRCRQAGSGQSCRLRSLALTLRPVHLRLDASSVGETLLGPFVAEADCQMRTSMGRYASGTQGAHLLPKGAHLHSEVRILHLEMRILTHVALKIALICDLVLVLCASQAFRPSWPRSFALAPPTTPCCRDWYTHRQTVGEIDEGRGGIHFMHLTGGGQGPLLT